MRGNNKSLFMKSIWSSMKTYMPVAGYSDMLSRRATPTQVARHLCSFVTHAMHINYEKQAPSSMFSLHPQYRAPDTKGSGLSDTDVIRAIKEKLESHVNTFIVKNDINLREGGYLEHDRTSVSKMFKQFKAKTKIEDGKNDYFCRDARDTWQSSAGDRNESIRKGKDTEIAKYLHECATLITLPDDVTLLFRGTGKENDCVEEFTSTSMSCEVGIRYIQPLMIIYVPNRKVRGHIIDDSHSTESEIMLTHPAKYMTQCSVEAATTLLNHLRDTQMILSFPKENVEYVQVWVYKIPVIDMIEEALVAHSEKFVEDKDKVGAVGDGGLLTADIKTVFAVFKEFAKEHIIHNTWRCRHACDLWQESGLMGSAIRLGEDTDSVNALHECAKLITLPDDVTLLFRGVGLENENLVEFTSTSMSCSVGLNFKPPLMIIYVPNRIVRGLVIYNEKNVSKESEFLLTNPEEYMTRRSDQEEKTLLEFLRRTEMVDGLFPSSNTSTNYLEVWVYDIPSTD